MRIVLLLNTIFYAVLMTLGLVFINPESVWSIGVLVAFVMLILNGGFLFAGTRDNF